MAGTASTDETQRTLAAVVPLLHGAAELIWRDADLDGVTSPLHSLGLGAYLAAGQATALLPGDAQPTAAELEEAHPLRLLRRAEELTRTLTGKGTAPVGVSVLVTGLGDLVREAENRGY